MPLTQLPSWLKPHLFTGKEFKDLTPQEIQHLKNKLSKFNKDDPDVSVVIPAWNEQHDIFRTLSSLSESKCKYRVEIIVINNNSSDSTQNILEELGVRNYFQPEQGITYARQLGLNKARGKYLLCADSDTFYPPRWIELMVKPFAKWSDVVGVYGRYSFVPQPDENRLPYYFYEKATGILVYFRKKKREYMNVLGFNMGLITEIGRSTKGFEVIKARKFDNQFNSKEYVAESEDGRMAVRLKEKGRLKLVSHPKARVFTSSRRLKAEGGVFLSFKLRIKQQYSRIKRSMKRG